MSDDRRSFSIDVKVGESVSIDRGRVVVTVLEKSGKAAKLGFDAEKGTPVNRMVKGTASAAMIARRGVLTA